MIRIKPEDRIIVTIPDYTGAGIYMIRNLVNGKVYVGSAKNIHNRIKEHDNYMRKGLCNIKFQEDIEKGHKFTCDILEKYDSIIFVELRSREAYYVKEYDCYNSGYNVSIVPTYDLDYYIRCGHRKMVEWLTRKV